MNAVLLLLALLSLATLASRRGGFAALLASSLPAFVAGLVTGPRALGYLSAPLVSSLAAATATGLCWLGLVLGWRASRVRGLRPRELGRAAIVVVVTAGVVVLTMTAAARWVEVPAGITARLATGILAAAILLPFSVDADDGGDGASRGLDLVVIGAVLVALALLSGTTALLASLGVLVVAVLLGMSALLVGGNDINRRFPAILSAAALVTGLAWAVDVHVGFAGIGIGVGLSLLDRGRSLDPMVHATAGPVALVMAFLVGALLPLRIDASILGVVVAVVVLAIVIAGSSDDDPATTHLDTAIQRAASSSTGLLVLGGLLVVPTTLSAVGDVGSGALGIALVAVDAAVVVAVLIKRSTAARRRQP